MMATLRGILVVSEEPGEEQVDQGVARTAALVGRQHCARSDLRAPPPRPPTSRLFFRHAISFDSRRRRAALLRASEQRGWPPYGGTDTEQTVLTGLAPNGGLYIPATMPTLPPDWQTDWAKLSFRELALEICSLFISSDEISREELRELVDRSYGSFRQQPDVAPLHKLSDRQYILELFHGPTYAFKDVALQFVGNLFEFFLKRRNKGKKADEPRDRLTVVGATSGDTGRCVCRADLSVGLYIPAT